MNYIVVCSAFDSKPHKPFYIHGSAWKQLVKERKERLSKLQSVGKELHEVSRYYSRRLDGILHITAKRIVKYAKNFEKPIIVMEDLDIVVKRQSKNKKQNYLLSVWARRKLQNLIEYKANWEGISIFKVNPYNTSRTCHRCGHVGKKESGMFYCLNCGKKYEADYNASVNIAKRFFVYKQKRLSRAIVSTQLSGTSNTQTTTNLD
jgi:putative transposase